MPRFAVRYALPAVVAFIAAATVATAAQGATACADLVKLKIPASDIALPSGGARCRAPSHTRQRARAGSQTDRDGLSNGAEGRSQRR